MYRRDSQKSLLNFLELYHLHISFKDIKILKNQITVKSNFYENRLRYETEQKYMYTNTIQKQAWEYLQNKK